MAAVIGASSTLVTHQPFPEMMFFISFTGTFSFFFCFGRQKESEQKLTRMETLTPEEEDIYENVDVDVAAQKHSWLSSLVSAAFVLLVRLLLLLLLLFFLLLWCWCGVGCFYINIFFSLFPPKENQRTLCPS